MDFLDIQYLTLLSHRLIGFKQKDKELYNFRCPFCGDSTKNKHKKRGFVYTKENKTLFKCHNCGKTAFFSMFLKELDSNLYNEYRLEKFKHSLSPKKQSIEEVVNDKLKTITDSTETLKVRIKNNYLRQCTSLSEITSESDLWAVKEYCLNRLLPEKYFDYIYACNDINKISKLIPKYQEKNFINEGMFMVVPFFKKEGSYDYIQCRSIEKDTPDYMRFVTFEIEENSVKLWGEQFIKWDNPIYILEGAIDAMFVDNSLALAGANVNKALEYIKFKQKQILGKIDKTKIVICLDTDYKENIQILDTLKKRIKEGYSVLIYDKKFKQKDMNDIILKENWDIEYLNEYIRGRIFNGLRATIELGRMGIK